MSTSQSPGGEPNEEELRAAYEAQLSQLRVEHIILDNVVMLINLGMRRTGLAPGTESERDPSQVRLAIESVRALLPQVQADRPERGRADPQRPLPAPDGLRAGRRSAGRRGRTGAGAAPTARARGSASGRRGRVVRALRGPGSGWSGRSGRSGRPGVRALPARSPRAPGRRSAAGASGSLGNSVTPTEFGASTGVAACSSLLMGDRQMEGLHRRAGARRLTL